MLTNFLRILVDLGYSTSRKVKEFKSKYPSETILVAGGTKGITLKRDQEVSSGSWNIE